MLTIDPAVAPSLTKRTLLSLRSSLDDRAQFVKQLSDSLTSLENNFAAIVANTLNINNITRAVRRKAEIVRRESTMESKLSHLAPTATFISGVDSGGTIQLIGSLVKQLTDLTSGIDHLDVSPRVQTDVVQATDDRGRRQQTQLDDVQTSRRPNRRTKTLLIGGGLLGITATGFAAATLLTRRLSTVAQPKEKPSESFAQTIGDIFRNIGATVSSMFRGGSYYGGVGDLTDVPVSGIQAAYDALAFFQSKGWTREQAAGIVGNLMVESGNFDPSVIAGIKRGDGGRAVGVAQWHPDRQARFQQVKGRSLIGAPLIDQLEFVNWELNNTERKAGSLLANAKTAAEAAEIVDRYYERSAGQHRGLRISRAIGLLSGSGTVGAGSGTGKMVGGVGVVTSKFGIRNGQMHRGIDIAAPQGTPVRALYDGVVVIARPLGGYGYVVYLNQDNGFQTRYGHLSSFAPGIKEGTRVRTGQLIGRVGNTGKSRGAHLHFEIVRGHQTDNSGQKLNPLGTYQNNKWIVGGTPDPTQQRKTPTPIAGQRQQIASQQSTQSAILRSRKRKRRGGGATDRTGFSGKAEFERVNSRGIS